MHTKVQPSNKVILNYFHSWYYHRLKLKSFVSQHVRRAISHLHKSHRLYHTESRSSLPFNFYSSTASFPMEAEHVCFDTPSKRGPTTLYWSVYPFSEASFPPAHTAQVGLGALRRPMCRITTKLFVYILPSAPLAISRVIYLNENIFCAAVVEYILWRQGGKSIRNAY